MIEIIIKIIPVILIFITGYILKIIKIFKKEDGDLLLKIVFNISLPALLILSISKIQIGIDFVFLPITSILIILIIFCISYTAGKLLHLKDPSFGVFLTGTLIMNIGFLLPFFIAAYGEEGLARASMFDFGNGLMVFTFIYSIACKYGNKENNKKQIIKKFVLSPPIWALFISIILNLSEFKIPSIANNFFQLLGDLTLPLIMLSLGIYFRPKIVKLLPLFAAIIIRMFIGLALGFLFTGLFDLDGLNRIIVLIGAAAPVGYNTLTFASMEGLDKEFAASLVSFSILIGMFFTPILILVL